MLLADSRRSQRHGRIAHLCCYDNRLAALGAAGGAWTGMRPNGSSPPHQWGRPKSPPSSCALNRRGGLDLHPSSLATFFAFPFMEWLDCGLYEYFVPNNCNHLIKVVAKSLLQPISCVQKGSVKNLACSKAQLFALRINLLRSRSVICPIDMMTHAFFFQLGAHHDFLHEFQFTPVVAHVLPLAAFKANMLTARDRSGMTLAAFGSTGVSACANAQQGD